MNTTMIWRWTLMGLAVVAIGFLASLLWQFPLEPVPRHGYRGRLRRLLRVESQGFAMIEPLIRRLSGVFARLPIASLRQAIGDKMERADGFCGLLVDEFLALSLMSACGIGIAATVAVWLSGTTPWVIAGASVLGAVLPRVQLDETIRVREKEVRRGLPSAIEIIALCMGAGLDFPGAIRLVAEPHKASKNAIKRELRVILEQLELGVTRREALRNFAQRVRIDAVRDFVNSVIQAEEKGNPLAKVIQIQGRMLSQKRSVFAEEAAARASVLLIVPMVLLMGCVLLILLGPFVVRGGGL